MLTPVLSSVLRIRVSDDDLAELDHAAQEQGITRTTLIRNFLQEGLSNFDRKHTQLMELVQALQLQLETANALSAATLGAVALLETQRFDQYAAGGVERLKGTVKTAITVGEAVIEGFHRGAFK